MNHYKPSLSKHDHLHEIVTCIVGNKPTLWSRQRVEKRLQDRKQSFLKERDYPGMSSLFVTDLLSYWFAQLNLCKSVIKLQIFGIFLSLDVQSCSFHHCSFGFGP